MAVGWRLTIGWLLTVGWFLTIGRFLAVEWFLTIGLLLSVLPPALLELSAELFLGGAFVSAPLELLANLPGEVPLVDGFI